MSCPDCGTTLPHEVIGCPPEMFIESFMRGHVEGVAAGIRQARDAAMTAHPFADGHYEDDWERGYRQGHEITIRRIDAVGETT